MQVFITFYCVVAELERYMCVVGWYRRGACTETFGPVLYRVLMSSVRPTTISFNPATICQCTTHRTLHPNTIPVRTSRWTSIPIQMVILQIWLVGLLVNDLVLGARRVGVRLVPYCSEWCRRILTISEGTTGGS